MLTLKGRTAVVTGGSRGIGYAISQALLEAGMEVAMMSHRKLSVEKAASIMRSRGYRCEGYQCDVSDPENIKSTLGKIYQHHRSIDVVVNCAGVLDMQPIDFLTEEEWDKVIGVNLKGTFFMIQHSVDYLENSKAPRIINISSNAGRMGGFENGLAYTASKGGIISLTYGAARRLAPKGITVNCIAPGTVESDMSDSYDIEARDRLTARIPLSRLGSPDEVAAAVCYFASEESGFTTGAVLDVNGGMFMG